MSRPAIQFSRNNERHLFYSGGLHIITGSSRFATLAGYSISFAEISTSEPSEAEDSDSTEFSEEDSKVICQLEKVGEKDNCDVFLTSPVPTPTQDNLLQLLEEAESFEPIGDDFDVDAVLNELFKNTEGIHFSLKSLYYFSM